MKDKNLIPEINKMVKELGLSGDQLAIGLQIYGPTAFHRMLSVMRSGTKSWSQVKQEGVVSKFQKLLSSLSEMDLTQDEFDLLASAWADFSEQFLTTQQASVGGKLWKSLTARQGKKGKKEPTMMEHFFPQQTKTQRQHYLEKQGSKS